jgi:glycine dehydrogenase
VLFRSGDAMIAIHGEVQDVISGKADKVDNALKNAPHPAQDVSATEWNHKYTREQAAYPVASLRQFKFWPTISRIDNPYGDRNLICACPPMSDYE